METGTILAFFQELVPQIGLLPSVGLLLTALLLGYWYRLGIKKDKMLKDLIEQIDQQSDITLDAMKSAITELKEVSVMSLKEISNVSGQMKSMISIVNSLLPYIKKEDKEVDS